MKRIFLCLLACVLTLASCSQEQEGKIVPPETVSVENVSSDISKSVLTGSQTTVTLTGLKEGELYGIYSSDNPSRSLDPDSDGSSGLIPAGNTGSYLYLADKDGDLTFKGSEAGIQDVGALRFVNYAVESDNAGFVINSKTDAPLFTAADGTAFYEEYYEIPLTEGIDPENVAVLSINKSQSVMNRATYYGVVTENAIKGSDEPENCGVMDLSGKESVRVINQMKLRLRTNKGGSAVRIALCNPTTLVENVPSELTSPGIYRVNASDSTAEYVLELTLDEGLGLYDFDTLINNSRPRYASGEKAGRVKNYIAPMSVSGDSILLYVGKLDQDFIFDFYRLYAFEDFENAINEEHVGKIELRQITDDERAKMVSIDIDEYKGPVDIKLTEDDPLKLVVFTADDSENLKGLKIRLDFVDGDFTDDGLMCKSYSSRDDSRGYRQNLLQEAHRDKTFVYDQNEHVDYLIFEDLACPSENVIRLTIEK